jgi:mRNA interferase MazF
LPGDIVLLPYPFTNYFDKKRRPALVLSAREFNDRTSDVILAAISSNVSRSSPYEVVINSTDPGFGQTNLKTSSVVKCGAIFAFSQAQIDKHLGFLPTEVMDRVKEVVRRIMEISSHSTS